MDALRQALNKLRAEVDKGALRRKEAEERGKILLATIEDKDSEIELLRERLDLSRRILTLTLRCNETRRAISANNDKTVLLNNKVDKLNERLGHVERARDSLEVQCLNVDSQRKTLETQLDSVF